MITNRLAARTLARLAALVAGSLLLGACTSYYTTRDDGVYDQTPTYRSAQAVYVDPLVYPFWSLDYFYYSRYYHPYSVVVNRFDPWYYPYPGWYYGYRPGPRFAGHRYRYDYPWYRHGDRYAGYRPWHYGGHLGFGRDSSRRDHGGYRVRELNDRLREIETRRSVAARDQRPDRQLNPRANPWLPATGRDTAGRRDDGRRLPPAGPGTQAARGRAADRQALIERLREADRGSRLPARNDRRRTPVSEPSRSRLDTRRDAQPATPPRSRDSGPSRSDNRPTAPSRDRSAPSPPARVSPPRRSSDDSRRPPQSSSRPRSSRTDQRERR